MKVLKFGGTSVGTVESLRNVKAIVEAIEPPVIVTVSALGGLTDNLIATARMAADGDEGYRERMEAISSRHFHVISEIVAEEKRPELISNVSKMLSDLKRNYDGVFLLRNLSTQTLDNIVSFGERLSSMIVAAMIENSSLHDSLKFIKTESWFSKNIADQKLTASLIENEFHGLEDRAIVPGFISTDKKTGRITNLGRGGSDFTAALIAAATGADSLEIWTDVDGFMTADPRIIGEATVVPHMTFIESMELCLYGAKVIYPPTIYPVFHKNIPIRILNTFNPTAPGTLITESVEQDDMPIKGISAIKGASLFSISGFKANEGKKIKSRAINSMARNGVTAFLVAQAEGECVFSFVVADAEKTTACTTLETEFAPELLARDNFRIMTEDNLAIMAIVGEKIKSNPRLGARIRNTLLRDGITVKAYSEGGSRTTISIVMPIDKTDRALRITHGILF